MLLKNLADKKILILGLGKEGIDTLKFLRKSFPRKILGVADRLKIKDLRFQIKDKRIKWHLGKNYLSAIRDYEVIIKSPGIPIHLPEVERAFEGGKITSPTEIFFNNCAGKIIGVTGSKGKGTTSSLIYEILRKGGIKTHLIGNIGNPVLSHLLKNKPNVAYVYEVSSHQLYRLKNSPHVAVLLNISPAHLDYFKSFPEYVKAKINIVRHQNRWDFLIYNSEDRIVKKIAQTSKAKKIPVSTIDYALKKIIKKVRKIPLIGKFNLLNIAAAVAVGKLFQISDKDIVKTLQDFKPLPHRLEFVGKYRRIKFYNDSLATVPEATCRALEALGSRVQTLITGGFDSHLDYQKLAKKILKVKIKTLILFPPTGKKIWNNVLNNSKKKGKLPKHFFVRNMKEAVKTAYHETDEKNICLLSCASPSFGIFKDYKERGDLFKKYVKMLA